MWLKTDLVMTKHPKTIRLAQAMGISRREAVGLLMDFFVWVRQYAETGHIEEWTPEEIDLGMDLPNNSDLFGKLTEAGWIKDGWLQKWPEYGGAEILDRAKRDPDKYREMVEHYDIIGYGKIRENSEKIPSRVDKKREDKKIKNTYSKEVEACYSAYPSSSTGRVRVAKSLKDKDQIVKVLKIGYDLPRAISEIALKSDYPPDLSNFLDNLPDLYVSGGRAAAGKLPEESPTAAEKEYTGYHETHEPIDPKELAAAQADMAKMRGK